VSDSRHGYNTFNIILHINIIIILIIPTGPARLCCLASGGLREAVSDCRHGCNTIMIIIVIIIIVMIITQLQQSAGRERRPARFYKQTTARMHLIKRAGRA
jgi:hypothetical protein